MASVLDGPGPSALGPPMGSAIRMGERAWRSHDTRLDARAGPAAGRHQPVRGAARTSPAATVGADPLPRLASSSGPPRGLPVPRRAPLRHPRLARQERRTERADHWAAGVLLPVGPWAVLPAGRGGGLLLTAITLGWRVRLRTGEPA